MTGEKNNDILTKKISFKKKFIISALTIIAILCLVVGLISYRNSEYNKYIGLANVSLKNDNFDEAINDYKLAGNYNSKYDYKNDVDNTNNIKSNLDLAKKSMDEQKYEEAMNYLDIITQIQSDNIEVNQLYSECKKCAAIIQADASAQAAADKAVSFPPIVWSDSTSIPSKNNEYTVYITETGSKYHRDGCRYLSKSKIAISESDAISEGYSPCSVCNP